MSDNFDYEAHENLRDRVANEADSVLWTFKAYYKAADFYTKADHLTDYAIFWVSGILAFALVWSQTPYLILVGLALLSAGLSAFRRMVDPGEKAKTYYRTAHSYQRLFDEMRDFIKLELARKEVGLEEMEESFRELADRRRDLNDESPELTDRWYNKLDDSIYDQVGTTEEDKERLTSEAKLVEDQNLSEDEKDQLTGDAKLSEGQESEDNESEEK